MSSCKAVGETATSGLIIVTANGGKTWTPQKLPSAAGALLGISCVSTNRCEVVGIRKSGGLVLTGLVLSTANGGTTWAIQKIPTSSVFFAGISCRSSTVCEAVGQNSTSPTGVALGTTNGGTTWINQKLPAKVADVGGVACVASPAACFAGGLSFSGFFSNGVILVYR
jgi:photosystem II stability/assembly factor-like uncharacterized protein